jgi:hypothetical protein
MKNLNIKVNKKIFFFKKNTCCQNLSFKVILKRSKNNFYKDFFTQNSTQKKNFKLNLNYSQYRLF